MWLFTEAFHESVLPFVLDACPFVRTNLNLRPCQRSVVHPKPLPSAHGGRRTLEGCTAVFDKKPSQKLGTLLGLCWPKV